MKKRLFTRLTCLTLTAAIVLSFSGFIYADETEEEILYESVIENEEVTDVDQDNDYLAEQYIMSKMPTKNKRVNVKYDYINHLDTYDQAAYLSLIPYITEIAAGTRTNTLFDVPELSFTLTNTQLGVADLDALSEEELKTLVKNNKPVHEDKVDEALINSFPYELYWYNRYYGLQMGYKAKRDKQNIVYYGFSFWFVVSEEYQLDGAANKVNSLFGQALTNAAKNVAKIIKDNAGLSDYEKLLAYNDTICQMTDYNHPAADNTSTPYGNPWQLVWIFDGDPNTMVVCEGFAKGFQYLCDNSVFRSDEVYVIPVKGTVMYNGQGGGHEWNIVHMDDGCNYLVDTTNSDGHLIDGHYTRLFMVGAQSGSVNGGYYVKFSDSNGVPNFTYFQDTIDFYGQAPLTLESSSYDPYWPYYVTVRSGAGGTAEVYMSESFFFAGDKINVTTYPDDGYEVDKITVNGKPIIGDWFYMPGKNAEVYVTFKKIDYSVSLKETINGSATVSKTTANYGDKIVVNANPNEGYEVDQIKVNGNPINGNTFTMPRENVTIEVTFKPILYKITVSYTEGGSAWADRSSGYIGDAYYVRYSFEKGYTLDYIKINGVLMNINWSSIIVPPFLMGGADVYVEVGFKKIDYSITVNQTEGGNLTVSSASANYNDKVTVTATPATGYKLEQIKVNDEVINGNYFIMPDSNVTVEATFKKIDYSITVNTSEGGTVSCQKTAQYGDKVTFTVTPATGYVIDKISSDEVTINNNSFTMPAGNVKVNVIFKKIDYKITVNAGEGGTVNCQKTANYGDKVTLTVTPATGYMIDKINSNDVTINNNSFTMPAKGVNISVTFKKIDYTITVNSGENGSATAPASGNYNDKITVTCTPAKGYEVDSITVNGTEIEGNTFTMPAEAVTVEVTFRKALYELSISNNAGGSATLSATSAYYGDEITVDVSADDGYHLAAIKVNGKAIEGNKFAMPDGKTAVEVVFEKNEYKITASAATGGKVTLSASAASAGTVITVKATADKGYVLDKITYTPDGGKAVDITSAAKFTMPAKDVTVKVTFKKTVAKVTLTLDKTSAKIVCGSTQTLKATLKNSSSKISWKSSDSKIASVNSNGKITAKQAGKVTITASAAGVSAACTVQLLFKDVVNEKDFWFTPTYYLVNKGVVKGYDNQTLFKPTNDCSRAQMITFLWRLQGEPAPKSSTNKFKDVKSSDYFYKASIWAVEQGITTVPSDKKFNPQGICTRAQTVTFLWRMAGKPDPKTDKCKFKDIKSSDYFYKATIWANEMKIVSGYDDSTFRPQGNCTRRQMVTFLYKYDKFVNGKG